jgi:hypothetical protein
MLLKTMDWFRSTIQVCVAIASINPWAYGNAEAHDTSRTVRSIISETRTSLMLTVRGKYLPDGPQAWVHDTESNFCRDGEIILVCMIELITPETARFSQPVDFKFLGWPSRNSLVPVAQRERAKLSKDRARSLPDCVVATGLYTPVFSRRGIERFFGPGALKFPTAEAREEQMRLERHQKGILILKEVHFLGRCDQ